jgi:hypothetical protein
VAYKRAALPVAIPEGEGLISAMVGIGMLFASTPAEDPNIEDTLLAASIEGMDRDDLRILSVLVTWFGIHHTLLLPSRPIKAGQP